MINLEQPLNEYNEIQNIKNELEKILKLLKENKLVKSSKLDDKINLKYSLKYNLSKKSKINNFSKFINLFYKGNYYEIKKMIEKKENELDLLERELKSLELKINNLGQLRVELNNLYQEKLQTFPQCYKKEDEILVITDDIISNYDTYLKNNNINNENNKVLVHCTNYFPKENIILSNFDGKKIGSVKMKYHGVFKETSALSHRHEVHFTINNRVESTGDGAGNWDDPSFIIVDDYKLHEKKLESIAPSDSWTKGISLKLSKNAVIMVKLQDKDKLLMSNEDLSKYNIIYYDGNPTICLKNFLRLNGYNIIKTDKNYAGHANSNRILQERGADLRDLAINFIEDNTIFTNQHSNYSIDYIGLITDIAIKQYISNILCSDQESALYNLIKIPEEKKKQYIKLANFIIGSGLIKTKDGKFTFLDDEEIFKNIERIKANQNVLPDFFDINLFKEIWNKQQEIENKHNNTKLPTLEEISNIPLQELYKFKNQLACESFQTLIPKNMIIKKEKDAFHLEINGEECYYIGKKLNENDNLQYIPEGSEWGHLNKTLNSQATPAKILEIIEQVTNTIEEIRSRSIEEQTSKKI